MSVELRSQALLPVVLTDAADISRCIELPGMDARQ